MDQPAIKDAATTIVLRDTDAGPAVLMGQRGHSAAFMPGKFVFPGGAVDENDAKAPLVRLDANVAKDLAQESDIAPSTLVAAAVRELWEETGLILGLPESWTDAPQGWRGFAAMGFVPSAAGCSFFFRAVTPAGQPRRFDARFILVDATYVTTDLDDFSRAEDELSHLQWVPLSKARGFDLPFITQVVLAELMANNKTKQGVPFFRNEDEDRLISRLGGQSPF